MGDADWGGGVGGVVAFDRQIIGGEGGLRAAGGQEEDLVLDGRDSGNTRAHESRHRRVADSAERGLGAGCFFTGGARWLAVALAYDTFEAAACSDRQRLKHVSSPLSLPGGFVAGRTRETSLSSPARAKVPVPVHRCKTESCPIHRPPPQARRPLSARSHGAQPLVQLAQ